MKSTSRKTAVALAIAGALAFPAATVQAAPIIKNPSFEEGLNFLGSPKGWFSLGDVSVVNSYTANDGSIFTATDGKKFVTMGGESSLLFSTTYNFFGPTVNVLFDWFTDYFVDNGVSKTTGWNTGTLKFGPDGKAVISFAMLGLDNPWTKTLGLDNFRIAKEVKVPEPATLALLLTGLSIPFFLRRREEVSQKAV